MAKWPYKSETELRDAGYYFKDDSRCKQCHAMIEWWVTPNGKFMPLDKDTLQPHWGTCPKADAFRRNQ